MSINLEAHKHKKAQNRTLLFNVPWRTHACAQLTTTHAHRAQHGPTSSAQNPQQGDGAGGARRHRVAQTARERGDAGAAAARGGGAGRVGGGAADVDARGRGVRRGPGAAPGGRAGRGRRAGGALPGMLFSPLS